MIGTPFLPRGSARREIWPGTAVVLCMQCGLFVVIFERWGGERLAGWLSFSLSPPSCKNTATQQLEVAFWPQHLASVRVANQVKLLIDHWKVLTVTALASGALTRRGRG